MKDLNALYDIADQNKLAVYHFPMEDTVSLSMPEAIALDTDRLSSSCDEKAALAHELGHCMTGSFYNIHTLETRGRMETRANRWAFRQLVPWEELKETVLCGITQPWELAEYFEVPEWFLNAAIHFYVNTLGYTIEP